MGTVFKPKEGECMKLRIGDIGENRVDREVEEHAILNCADL
jgi:hypothetical protein